MTNSLIAVSPANSAVGEVKTKFLASQPRQEV